HLMDTKTQLNESMKDAMKTGDEVRKRTVRMALAAIKQVEVDKRTTLDDVAVIGLVQKEIKNRREALEEAKKANRADLVEANEQEIRVLEAFLPKAMPAEELRALVQNAIAETGASSPSDMGKVMKIVMGKVAGRAPGDVVSATVKELLLR
ncbi:MAG: GatB/YqeY domain-containing protein, partial [Chloroflexota bacterium]